VALSVAVLMGNASDQVQRQQFSLKVGFSEEWLRELLSLVSDGPAIISEQEWLVQQLMFAVTRRAGRNTTPEIEAVTRAIGPAQAIAVLMLIGRYISHALIVNTLKLAPPRMSLPAQDAATHSRGK
jgi:hypothetical protein